MNRLPPKPNGRFQPGNPGGPGRPRKQKQFDGATLRDIADAGKDGTLLYLTAMVLRDRDEWLEKIEDDFSPEVVTKIKTLVAISTAVTRPGINR